MKGNISLGDFIMSVKSELVKAQATNRENAFYELKEVELEVTFALDASAKAGAKLFVVDIGGETKATQTHKVTLKLEPIRRLAKDKQADKRDEKDLAGTIQGATVYLQDPKIVNSPILKQILDSQVKPELPAYAAPSKYKYGQRNRLIDLKKKKL